VFKFKDFYIFYNLVKKCTKINFNDFIVFYFFVKTLECSNKNYYFLYLIFFVKTNKVNNIFFLKNSFINYKKYLVIFNFFYSKMGLIFDKNLKKKKLFVKKNFTLNSILSISTPTFYKSLNFLDISKNNFFFLRKNRVFNKGRYSRNRQTYRTGVYLCFYISVISVFGLYFVFFNFSFNFSYLWVFFFLFFSSFFFNKIVKYRLYEPNKIISKFFNIFN
jgi:hypothetical protein